MNYRLLLLGTLAYTLVTFTLAITWHLVLFKPQYEAFGYFEGEPDLLLGLITIMIQGAVLSFLYPYIGFTGGWLSRGLRYALVLGLFFWTSHVLAFIAKQTVAQAPYFILMESFYLLLQFGLYGLLIGLIDRQTRQSAY